MNPFLLFFTGRCDIVCEGGSESRIADAFLISGMRYVSLEKEGGNARLKVCRRDRFKTLALLDKSDIKVYSIKGKGLPYAVGRYKKRYGVITGLLTFFLLVFFSSRTVWDVRVKGCPSYPREFVLEKLKECGLYYGASLFDFDSDKAESRFLENNPAFSWIAINVTGSVAEVELRETGSDGRKRTFLYSNLVAKEDGQIVRTAVTSGQTAVTRGDVVKKGDLLVSGFIEKKNGFETARSQGEVFAFVTKEFSVFVPYEKTELTPSGESLCGFFIEAFGKRFGHAVDNACENEEIKVERERVELFGKIKLPVFTERHAKIPYEKTTFVLSRSEAKKEAYSLLQRQTVPALEKCEVIELRYDEEEQTDGFFLRLYADCIDDIACEKRILSGSNKD